MDAFSVMPCVIAVNVCDRKKWFPLAERSMAVAARLIRRSNNKRLKFFVTVVFYLNYFFFYEKEELKS